MSQSSKSDNVGILFDRLKQGSNLEKKDALQELCRRVQETKDDPEAKNHLALGLQIVGKFTEAINIFKQLIQAYPDQDIYRLNLATTHSQARQFDLCKYHLQYLLKYGQTDEMHKIANEQLKGLEHFLGKENQDRKLREIQIGSLRERIKFKQDKPEDYLKCGRFLLSMDQQEPQGHWLDEAIEIFEEGCKQFPESVSILEHLVLCYLRNDPWNRLDELLKTIERLAPDSPVFDALNNDDRSTEQFYQQRLQHAYDLFEQVQSGDEELKQAALQDLQRMVARTPTNPEYRIVYTWSLLLLDKKEEALKQAEIIHAIEDDTHEFHFNLGQIFSICGDSERGKYHLKLSLQYAKNEQQRQDAIERMADLSKNRKDK